MGARRAQVDMILYYISKKETVNQRNLSIWLTDGVKGRVVVIRLDGLRSNNTRSSHLSSGEGERG